MRKSINQEVEKEAFRVILFIIHCSLFIKTLSLQVKIYTDFVAMNYTINVNGRLMDLSEPKVMGILNATPDSFYAGSRKQTEREIAERAEQIIAEGGAIIDIGAYSTRPNAARVTQDEEMERLRRALEAVQGVQSDAVISVDTFRPDVARMAVEEYGVAIINDVSEGNVNGAFGGTTTSKSEGETAESGEEYPQMFRMVAHLGIPYILMSVEADIISMIRRFSKEVQQLRDLGAKDIILDPGFGFGKTLEQNYQVLADLKKLNIFELPVLVGASRKSMISRLVGTDTSGALNGTTVINTIALLQSGASVLRVHDVRQCVEAVKIVEEVRKYI